MSKSAAKLQAIEKREPSRGDAIAIGRRRTAEAEQYFLEKLDSAQKLEAFLKKFDFDQLVKLEDTVKKVKEEKRRDAEEERKAAEEREKVEQKIKELATEHGIELEIKGATARKRKVKANPEKYAIEFKDTGNIYYWSGMGHPPKYFKHALDKGIKKETLLNPKSGKPYGMTKEPK